MQHSFYDRNSSIDYPPNLICRADRKVFAASNVNETIVKNISIILIFILVSVVVFGESNKSAKLWKNGTDYGCYLCSFCLVIIFAHIGDLPRSLDTYLREPFKPNANAGGIEEFIYQK